MQIQVERDPRGVPVPFAHLTQSATAIADNSFTTANLTSTTADNGATTCGSALADLSTDRITLRRSGIWVVQAFASWAANGTGYRSLTVALNGTTFGGELNSNMSGFFGVSQSATAVHYASGTSDYVTAIVYQNSGGNLNATVTLKAVWLGAY
jgi:hypothetical protein